MLSLAVEHRRLAVPGRPAAPPGPRRQRGHSHARRHDGARGRRPRRTARLPQATVRWMEAPSCSTRPQRARKL